jgi:hypothetical protein
MLEETWYHCAYCGEAIETAADRGQPSGTSYVEDCQVCCRPNRLTVRFAADGAAHLTAEADG